MHPETAVLRSPLVFSLPLTRRTRAHLAAVDGESVALTGGVAEF